jgi:hypothetical protein
VGTAHPTWLGTRIKIFQDYQKRKLNMSFDLLVLFNDSIQFNEIEDVQCAVLDYFSHDKSVGISILKEPFVGKSIKIWWDNWSARFFLEESNQTIEDNNYIIEKDEKILHILCGSISNRRIRVFFSSDDKKEYTNRCLDIIEFVKSLPNSLVYNPQEENIWN